MRSILLQLSVILSALFISQAQAQAQYSKGIQHIVIKDKLADSGAIHIQYRSFDEKSFEARFKYDFKYRFLFISRHFQGEEIQPIPNSYLTEDGYLELERTRRFEDSRVTLTYLKRSNWKDLYDCHMVKIEPKVSVRWEGKFIYCPDLPETGIAQMQLTVKKIPFIGSHTFISNYKP